MEPRIAKCLLLTKVLVADGIMTENERAAGHIAGSDLVRDEMKRAEAWFAKYDKTPATLKSALDAARDVPIDVDPTFSLPEVIE